MKTKIIACETLRDELELALQLTQSDYEIYWVASGLHSFPKKLRVHLQHYIDSITECNRVLMAFGACGNAAVGLRTREKELIFPKVDDCASMLIGSIAKRTELAENCTYCITPGLLRGQFNVWQAYQYLVKEYGEKTGAAVTKRILSQYKYLGLLQDDSYDLESFLPTFHQVSAGLKLEERLLPASVQYLLDLLSGPWEEDRFHIFPPQSVITAFPF